MQRKLLIPGIRDIIQEQTKILNMPSTCRKKHCDYFSYENKISQVIDGSNVAYCLLTPTN
jgi:hypothetical protein